MSARVTRHDFHLPLHLTRGMAIFLVVLGHALGPIQGSSIPGSVAAAVVTVIFSFHMPLFFFISGFVGTRVVLCTPQEVRQVIVRQFKRLMVVYFFYTAVAVVAKLMAANYVNRPIEWQTLLSVTFLYPYSNPLLDLWFLYALFMIQMLFIAFGVVGGIDCRKPTHAAVLCVVLLTANGLSRWLSMDTVLGIYAITKYALYFLGGFLVSCYDKTIQVWLRQYKGTVVRVGGLYLLYAFLFSDTLRASWLLSLLGAIIGIILAWACGIYLADTPGKLAGAMSQLSDHSYAIYLNEGFFQEAVKIVIMKLLSWHTLLVLPAGLLGGIFLPMLLSKFLLQKVIYFRRFALGDWR